MRIQIVSDLDLKFRNPSPEIASSTDVLVGHRTGVAARSGAPHTGAKRLSRTPETRPMHPDHAPILVLPNALSDQAAAETLELLYAIATVVENHYADQIRRYRFPADQRQQPLWKETDPPF